MSIMNVLLFILVNISKTISFLLMFKSTAVQLFKTREKKITFLKVEEGVG